MVVLPHSFWQTQFSKDPAVVGKSLRIVGESCKVIGVAPRLFGALGCAGEIRHPSVVAAGAGKSPGLLRSGYSIIWSAEATDGGLASRCRGEDTVAMPRGDSAKSVAAQGRRGAAVGTHEASRGGSNLVARRWQDVDCAHGNRFAESEFRHRCRDARGRSPPDRLQPLRPSRTLAGC